MLMLELLELELGFVRWGLVFVAIVVVIGVGVEVELVSDVTTSLTHSCRVFVFSVASSGADSSAEIGDLAGVIIIIIKHFTLPLLQLLQLTSWTCRRRTTPPALAVPAILATLAEPESLLAVLGHGSLLSIDGLYLYWVSYLQPSQIRKIQSLPSLSDLAILGWSVKVDDSDPFSIKIQSSASQSLYSLPSTSSDLNVKCVQHQSCYKSSTCNHHNNNLLSIILHSLASLQFHVLQSVCPPLFLVTD